MKVTWETNVGTEEQKGRDRERMGEVALEYKYITNFNKEEIINCNSWGRGKGTEGRKGGKEQIRDMSEERNETSKQGCAEAGKSGRT